jgi:hypothetical protein
MPDGRKIKEWALYQKVSATYNGQTYYPDASHPLRLKVQSSAGLLGEPNYQPEVNVVIEGEAWILIDSFDSFEIAKQEVTKLGGQVGLDQLKLSRTVDLNNVLYPIS